MSNGHGHHHIQIADIVPNGSLYRDGRVLPGDRITHISGKRVAVAVTLSAFSVCVCVSVSDRITHISGKNVEEYPVGKILEEIMGPCASMLDLAIVREASDRVSCLAGTLCKYMRIFCHLGAQDQGFGKRAPSRAREQHTRKMCVVA